MIAMRVLIAVVLLAATPPAFAAGADAKRPLTIYMLLYRGCEFACKGFISYFQDHGYKVNFVMRDAAGDRSKIPAFVGEVKAQKPDLVVTWGTTVTLDALGPYDAKDKSGYITEVPAIFMIVSSPVETKVVPNLDGSGRNITGTTYLVPEETQIQAIRSYRPFRKLGLIYNTDEANAVANAETLRQVARKMDFELIEETVPLENGRPMASALPELVAKAKARGAQFLYIGSSSFILVNRDLFTSEAVRQGIPVAAAGEVPITQSRALVGLVSRYYNIGMLSARQAERILVQGENPARMPIEGLKRFSLIVNMSVAKELNLYPPMSMLRFAEIVQAPR